MLLQSQVFDCKAAFAAHIGCMRYHGLDLLRASAMLLGFLLHALLIFDEPEVRAEILPGTQMGAVEISALGWVIYVWIHIWRMPLFFVLAGFFAAMVIERKGRRAFLQDRTVRIVGALVIFLPLFNLLSDAPWGRLDHLWFLWFLSHYDGGEQSSSVCLTLSGLFTATITQSSFNTLQHKHETNP